MDEWQSLFETQPPHRRHRSRRLADLEQTMPPERRGPAPDPDVPEPAADPEPPPAKRGRRKREPVERTEAWACRACPEPPEGERPTFPDARAFLAHLEAEHPDVRGPYAKTLTLAMDGSGFYLNNYAWATQDGRPVAEQCVRGPR